MIEKVFSQGFSFGSTHGFFNPCIKGESWNINNSWIAKGQIISDQICGTLKFEGNYS